MAADGAEAVAMSLATAYSAILIDCHMPRLDGYAATAAIRDGSGSCARTPIVAMTASALAGDRERCLTAGMDDYLSKPLQISELETRGGAGSTANCLTPIERLESAFASTTGELRALAGA